MTAGDLLVSKGLLEAKKGGEAERDFEFPIWAGCQRYDSVRFVNLELHVVFTWFEHCLKLFEPIKAWRDLDQFG